MEGKVITVKVAVRSRPMSEAELIAGCQSCVTFVPNEPQLVIGKDKAFTFDFVYPSESSQHEIYQQAVFPLVSGLFRGLLQSLLVSVMYCEGVSINIITNSVLVYLYTAL